MKDHMLYRRLAPIMKGDTMQVHLTKVKVFQQLSEETTCFTADILFDKELVGRVRNRGQGGCHEYDWFRSGAAQELDAVARAWAATCPEEHYEVMDEYIEHLREEIKVAKLIKREVRAGRPFIAQVDRSPVVDGDEILGYLDSVVLSAVSEAELRAAVAREQSVAPDSKITWHHPQTLKGTV